jgi:hypothetical protein
MRSALALLALVLLVGCSSGGGVIVPESAPAADPTTPPAPLPPTAAPPTVAPAATLPAAVDPTRLAEHPDAAAYAEMFGISLDEAIRRLELSPQIGQLGALLETTYPDTFAGMWIENEPTFKLVAAFTADAEATLARHVDGTPLADIAEARTFPVSYRRLQEEQMVLFEQLREAIPGVNSSMIDVRVNGIVIGVDDPAAFEAALAASGMALPPYVTIVQEAAAFEE